MDDPLDDPRGLLDELRHRALRRLARLSGDFDGVVAASRDTNADDEHDPEGATIAFERSHLGALVQQAQDRLTAIDAAMNRLDSGMYGTCEGCGRPIAVERLRARPLARTCIECAEQVGGRQSPARPSRSSRPSRIRPRP